MLNIPERFRIDTDSKTIDLKPLVIIDDRFYLSTSKESLEEFIFKPLIKNIGSIKESIDIQNKTFKISSITLSLYNYKYDDEYLSDMIFSPSVMNKKITIYMKSQTAENLGDCLEIYNGYVKNIKEASGILSLSAEDKADEVLNKKVPYKFVRDDINLPEKYRNEPIPIVYGYVDKAPCVYFDLYSTTIENGSRDWAITPDLSAIKSINFPYVFSSNTYGRAPEESWLFESQKGGTLYRNGTSEQYQILGNRILIPRAMDMGESPEESIQGVVAPVTAFGMIEVWALQDATFNSSFFRFDWRGNQQGPVSAKTNIVAFSEEEGINPTQNVENSYLMVKDFSSIGGTDFPFNHWLWGTQTHADYENLLGESTINFEVNNFFSDGKIVKELPVNDEEVKEIKHQVGVNYIFEANLTELSDGESPNFRFGYTDTSAEMWNPADMDEVSLHPDSTYTIRSEETVHENMGLVGGISSYAETKNPSHSNFFIGQRNLVGENWNLESQTGIVNWLKIIKLKLWKRVLLKDLSDFGIYADVEGRVDTVSGDYAGERQYTSGERVDYYQGREGIGTYSPRQGISLDRRTADTKVASKNTKRTLKKKGTKY
tara:strand:- start:2950 stop:4752 length:1803 start_codon:yes stop_codon:yes gene_type:complete